ncbi:hypothetical protein [Halorubrum tibetense]|uniref:Asparagine synthetase domain-containing protein n=1 Tax=Halorubrum tibetense TaxID=175631 RepID=A0ABD5SAM0_9EURY
MAELISLCGRGGTVDTYTAADLETVADRILPENAPRNVEVVRDDGVLTCRINAPESLPTHGTSTCLGRLIPRTDDWHDPGAPVADGSYGIVRVDSGAIELVADATASRTIYYRLFEDLLVASTSQRAIAHFADEFVPDERAIAWMISSGSLGPGQAWDARTEYVPPGGNVRIDRSTWELTETTTEVSSFFEIKNRSREEHREELSQSIETTIQNLDIEPDSWVLALSGGMDSRGLIQTLHDRLGLTAITWGTAEALDHPDSDAVRARELADAYGIPHEYYELPQHPSDIGTVFDRFVTAGEGRIDHISGYLDGFRTFKTLAEDHVGIIRGNNPFGWSAVSSQTQVRRMVGGQLISDYEVMPSLSIPGADAQQWPAEFAQADDESLATWRDRLKLTYRLAIVQSALTSLKTPYIEEINPFLSREIIQTVCTLPDKLRTEKRLYHEYVQQRSPDVPVATRSANPDTERLLNSDASIEFLRDRLDTDHARSVLGDELIDHAFNELGDSGETTEDESGSVIDTIKREVGSQLPQSVIQRIEEYTPVERPSISMYEGRLGFRLYIIVTMSQKLENDGRVL